MTRAERAGRALADFGDALATFNAHPTIEAFREVQLAGGRVDDARRAAATSNPGAVGGRPRIPSTEGSVR